MEVTQLPKLEDIRIVPSERNYWLIRTYTGKLFSEFLENGYVAVGFNKISLEELLEARPKPDPSTISEESKEIIKNNRKEIKRLKAQAKSQGTNAGYESAIRNLEGVIGQLLDPGLKARKKIYDKIASDKKLSKGTVSTYLNQLVTFVHEIKPMDVVLIPDEGSNIIAVGEVVSEVYSEHKRGTFRFKRNSEYVEEEYPDKRYSVKWESLVSKYQFGKDAFGLFAGQNFLKSVDQYREYIEAQISPLYILEDELHVEIEIKQHEDINAGDLSDLLGGLTYFYEFLPKHTGENVSHDLTVRLRVQSEGKGIFKGKNKYALFGTVLIFLGTAGVLIMDNDDPKIKVNFPLGGSFEYEGKSRRQSKHQSQVDSVELYRLIKENEIMDERAEVERLRLLRAKQNLEAAIYKDSVEAANEKEKLSVKPGKGKNNKDDSDSNVND